MAIFRLSIRLLDGAFHGWRDGGEPEWPPSPLRAFQALLNAAARRWRVAQFEAYARPALEWLEGLGHPTIAAPPGRTATRPYRLYVPNNAGDLMVAAWARGNNNASMAEHRTEKDVRPTRFAGPDGRPLEANREFHAVHYDWPLTPDQSEKGLPHLETLKAAARSITHLGWGVDQAVGHAELLTTDPPVDPATELWQPVQSGGSTLLRVPRDGTLADLRRKYDHFLGRLQHDSFNPVPPPSAFEVVGYRQAAESTPRPFIAFELRTPDFERFQPYAPTRHACAVAGMVRNALAGLADQMRPFGWTGADINTFIHGHTPDGERQARGPDAERRFAYLPLPSLERRGSGTVVTGIRRVLIVGPPGGEQWVAWAKVLSGHELSPADSRTPSAALRLIDRPIEVLRSDPNFGPYIGEARVWSTVTPVVLPGYDEAAPRTVERRVRMAPDEATRRRVREGADARTGRLLRRAFEQAGMPPELVRAASLEWRHVGFRPGVDLATRYERPQPIQMPRYHVRVRWPAPVRGPLFVGAVRYRGLGIFAYE
jgi:CRISPR-associated protein Csb2